MSVSRFRPSSDGRAMNIEHGPKAASQVIAQNELLTRDASGNLIPAVIGSTSLAGISLSQVNATDENYATTDDIQFDEAREGDEFIMSVDDASTAGFVPGVTRAILNSTTVKAAADGVNANFVVVKKVLTATDEAVVSFVNNPA